jgi:putative membrane protein
METNLLNNQHDFTVPQRQSLAAIFMLMVKSAVSIGKTLWPILLVTLFKPNKEGAPGKWLYIIIGFAILSILLAFIHFIFYRFQILGENLVIKTGWLKKKTLSIPMRSIQAVHLEQNIWQQVFNVSKVSFDSAGTEKIEAQIDAIDTSKAELLKQILLSHNETPELEKHEVVEEAVYRLSGSDLMKLSLSANHAEAFFILFALGVNMLDNLKKAFDFDSWGWFGSIADKMQDHFLFCLHWGLTCLIILKRHLILTAGDGLALLRTKCRIIFYLL